VSAFLQSINGIIWRFSHTPHCCLLYFTASLALTAFSKVSLGSICSFSARAVSLIPTTMRSRISSSCRSLNLQCSASPYKEVINESADSPSYCMQELNLALSKIMFRRTIKCSWKQVMTVSYLFWSSSDKLKDCNMSAHCVDQYIDLAFFWLCCKSGSLLKSLKMLKPLRPLFWPSKVKARRWSCLKCGHTMDPTPVTM